MKHISCCAVVACLVACEGGGAPERPALTHEELLNPETCKDCHPKHYDQWSASMHAYATEDPVFQAMNRRGQEETNGALGDFCVQCHAPMALVEPNAFPTEGMTKFSNPEALPKHLQGVTCYFCHNATGVGTDHFNGNITVPNDDVMRAAIRDPIEPSTHKVAFSSFHNARSPDSSLMCGSCHDIVNPLGLHLERTFEEYSQSIHSEVNFSFQSCQDCHMGIYLNPRPVATQTGRSDGKGTNARDFHPHLWPAVDLALTDWPFKDAMRSAVEKCEFKRTISYMTVDRDPGPLGQLTLHLEAEAGHNIPSGATQDRRLWVEITGYDAAKAPLYTIGAIEDGQLEEPAGQPPHPCMLRDYVTDQNGQETHDFWEMANRDTTRGKAMPFRPKGSTAPNHTQECVLNPPLQFAQIEPETIEVRLRMRPMGMDVLQDLVSTNHLSPAIPPLMQTMTVVSWTFVHRPAERTYELVASPDGDCSEWECMMDPASELCRVSAAP
jgi:hypothetical protein